MCFPGAGAAASAGLGIASAAASFSTQQTQFAMQEQQYNTNYQDALVDNRASEDALTQRQMQEQQAHSQKSQMALVEGAQKSAQVTVGAASAGVTGNSVNDLINGVGEQINQKQAVLQQNWQNTASQLQSQKTAGVLQEQNQIAQVQSPIEPNAAGAVLTGAAGVAKAASTTSGTAGLSAMSAGLNLAGM